MRYPLCTNRCDTKLNDFIRCKHVFVLRNQVFWVAESYGCDISSWCLEGRYRLRCQDSVDECSMFHRCVGKGTTMHRTCFFKSHAVETSHHYFYFVRNIGHFIFYYCIVCVYCVLLMYNSLWKWNAKIFHNTWTPFSMFTKQCYLKEENGAIVHYLILVLWIIRICQFLKWSVYCLTWETVPSCTGS